MTAGLLDRETFIAKLREIGGNAPITTNILFMLR